jgi:hypothetical protein
MDSRDCLAHYPLSSSGLRAASARGAAHIGSRDWLLSSDRRSAFATSRTGSPTTAFGGPRRGQRRASQLAAYTLPDLEQPRPPDAPPGMVKLRLVKST